MQRGEAATIKAFASSEISLAVDLAAATGLRLEDLLRLRWSNVGENAITVTTGKSRHQREAIIPRYEVLNDILDRIPRGGPTVLLNSRQRAWTKAGFGSSFAKAKRRAGLKERDLHFHDLRGTAATRFYTAGLTERVIGEILGWEEVHVSKIMRRYVSRTSATQAVIEQLNHSGSLAAARD
jgi:integrase